MSQSSSVESPGEVVVEIVDLEEYGKSNRKPPKAKQYRIRIDKVQYVVDVSSMTGRQLLTRAGKTPVERFTISQKFHGGQAQRIDFDEVVDFTAQGVERFMTLPLDQGEG